MDTLGGLVDKLSVINLKMWNNQELLYQLRQMTFDEFMLKYFNNQNQVRELFECLKKCCDLNVQRNDLMDEIDQMFKRWITAASQCTDKYDLDTHELTQKKHKSYGDSDDTNV